MADLSRIKRNVRKMVGLGASEQEIDTYISSEGTTINAVRGFKEKTIQPTVSQEKLATKFIPQFTKALHENLPFGKRIVGMLPNQEQIQANLAATPPPASLRGKVGAIGGAIAPQAITTGPILKGAGLIPRVPRLLKTAIGLGAAGGVQAKARNQPVLPAAAIGAGQGLLFGAAGKLGASAIPRQIPFAERIGSAAGGAAVGALTAPKGQKAETAAFLAGLGALAPAQRAGILQNRQVRVNNIIDRGVSKGIRPSIGSRSFSQLEGSKQKSREAIKTIIERKDALNLNTKSGLPESLSDAANATEQTKRIIYSEYNNLATQAGKSGAIVNTKPAISFLRGLSKEKAFRIKNKALSKYVDDLADNLESEGNLTPLEADDLIRKFNVGLKAWMKNQSFADADKVSIDGKLTDILRKSLDKSVSGATGREFQTLKNRYGSLLSIEKDLVNRVLVDSRKNVKGFFDLPDILSNGQIARGLFSFNPADIAQGVTQKAMVRIIKSLNDPNRQVADMFKQVNKLHIPRPPVLTPEVVTPRPNIRGLLPPPAQPRTIPVSGQRALPPSSQIYGRGFSLSPTTPLPTPPHQQVLGTSRVPPKALTFRPTLEKGAIRTGPGFTVKGGLKSRGQIGKRWAKILRTTPPEQAQRTIQDMPPHLRSDAVRFLRELWGRQ